MTAKNKSLAKNNKKGLSATNYIIVERHRRSGALYRSRRDLNEGGRPIKKFVIAALATVFAGPAFANVDMICEHPVSHQQVQFSIDVDQQKLTVVDAYGTKADWPWTDAFRTPAGIVNIHFGPKEAWYFIDFANKPAGYAARFVGGMGYTHFTTYCIIPGRIVQ